MENKYNDYKTENGLLANQKQAKLHELFHVEENHLKFLIEVTNFFKEILRTKDDQVYVIDIPENLDKSQIEDFSLIYDICDFHQNSFTHNLRRCQDNALHMRNLFRSRKHQMKDIYGRFCIKLRKCEENLLTFYNEYFYPLKCYFQLEFPLEDLMISDQACTNVTQLPSLLCRPSENKYEDGRPRRRYSV